MKKILLFVLIMCNFIFCSCSDDNDELDKFVDIYIIGYNPCAGYDIDDEKGIGTANALYVTTADYKDTLLVIDVPKNDLKFPSACFYNKDDVFAFPDEYNSIFKNEIKYEVISVENEKHFVCDAHETRESKFNGNYRQIKLSYVIPMIMIQVDGE